MHRIAADWSWLMPSGYVGMAGHPMPYTEYRRTLWQSRGHEGIAELVRGTFGMRHHICIYSDCSVGAYKWTGMYRIIQLSNTNTNTAVAYTSISAERVPCSGYRQPYVSTYKQQRLTYLETISKHQ